VSIEELLPRITTPPYGSSNVIELSYSTSVDWLSETNDFEDFFEQYVRDYLPVNATMKPVKLNKQELKEIFTSNRVFVSLQKGQQSGPLTMKKLPTIATLSYCSIILLDISCRIDMYFYGQIAGLSDHVRKQLLHISTVAGNSVTFFIHFSKNLKFQDVENCLKDFGVTRTELGPEYKHFEAVICFK